MHTGLYSLSTAATTELDTSWSQKDSPCAPGIFKAVASTFQFWLSCHVICTTKFYHSVIVHLYYKCHYNIYCHCYCKTFTSSDKNDDSVFIQNSCLCGTDLQALVLMVEHLPLKFSKKCLYHRCSVITFSVALNYQTEGRMLELNRAKFANNGNCGYNLKPKCMCKGWYSYEDDNVA